MLARFDRIVDWAPAVGHSEAMTSPTSGPGAARRVQVGPLTLVETVVEWDEGRAMAYTLEGLPPFARRAVNRWVLEPAGPERTTVTLTLDMTPGARPPLRVVASIATAVVQRANGRMLDGLGHAVIDRDHQGTVS